MWSHVGSFLIKLFGLWIYQMVSSILVDHISDLHCTLVTGRGRGDSAPDAGEEDDEEDDPGHVLDAPPPEVAC